MHFTVYFNGQFWVGLMERYEGENFFSGLFTFSEDPQDGQLLNFINFDLPKLIDKQNEHVTAEVVERRVINPKRLKRLAVKALKRNPMSTKAKDAIKKQQESNKKESEKMTRLQKEQKEQYKREKAIEKRKSKLKGH